MHSLSGENRISAQVYRPTLPERTVHSSSGELSSVSDTLQRYDPKAIGDVQHRGKRPDV